MKKNSVKQVAGIDYVAFDYFDYICGRFEQNSEYYILYHSGKAERKLIENKNSKMFVSELKPNDSHVSFGGKCREVVLNSRNGSVIVYLISYNTAVAKIDSKGRFIRLWNGYSATTARHIAAFTARYKLHGISKKEWLNMPIGTPSGIAVE